jgi:adenosine deaminase
MNTIRKPLAELHAHLGTSISPVVLWRIAHDMGLKLPKSEFSEFRDFITLRPDRRMTLNEYFDKVYHSVLDPLSTGTYAVEQATYFTVAGGCHSQNITLMELRNNPMKHNNNAQFDLDHTTMAMLRGMERALLENQQLSAGLIFCMAREFDIAQNAIILEKAIKYRHRGIVGIDMAGPYTSKIDWKQYEPLFAKAHDNGLGVTIHAAEVRDQNELRDILRYIRPQRIGHGIHAAYDDELLDLLVETGTVLEICPMSNIMTKAVRDVAELKFILRKFLDRGVKFCINTDWPEVIEDGHLRKQIDWLEREGLMTADEIAECGKVAFEASFVPEPGNLDAYLK